ncbi:hypothetical protein Pelo_15149 [Pelomyxa schiedti]|nr:hypothetical protein Pelo_15149 [Pelomyxa schiedti]
MGHHKSEMGKVESWIWLSFEILTEVYTATIVLLMYGDNKDVAWAVYACTTIPRVIYWLVFSIRLNMKNFWKKWLSVDGITVTGIGSIVAYVYLVTKSEGEKGWRIAASVAYVVLIFSLSGVFRCIISWFPFDLYSVRAYKYVRIYHALFYCINEIVQHVNEVAGEEGGETTAEEALFSALQLFFVLTTLHYVYHLMGEICEVEHELRHEAHHKEEGKGEGVSLDAVTVTPSSAEHH